MGYTIIPPQKFMIGALVVTAPVLFLDNQDWAWGYVLLILVSFAAFNAAGLTAFSGFINGQLRS